jgi:hypothetical protein
LILSETHSEFSPDRRIVIEERLIRRIDLVVNLESGQPAPDFGAELTQDGSVAKRLE